MKTKCLVTVMSFLLVLGLSIPVSAGWVIDDVSDTVLVSDVDMKKVGVAITEVGTTSASDPAHTEAPWMNACIEMEAGSKMPGMVMFEFDVDNNVATGGGTGMLKIPFMCNYVTSEYPGTDVILFMYLRDQGPESSNSWCHDELGFIPGADCTNCDVGGCKIGNDMCTKPGSGCMVVEGMCVCDEETCFVPGDPFLEWDCEGKGRKIGEWIVKAVELGGSVMPPPSVTIDYGRLNPKPLLAYTGDGDMLCAKLPWGEILRNAHEFEYEGTPKAPVALDDDTKLGIALTTAPNYVVSIYYDTESGFPDGCDYVTIDTLWDNDCNLADYIPQDGMLASEVVGADLCNKYQGKLDTCTEESAGARELNVDICKVIDNQTACDAAGCYWYASKSRCRIDICLGDALFTGKVTGGDKAAVNADYGRSGCP